ncbi:MAG TPA: hypothetical protein VFQ88_10195 [Nevskiaceae bacterium]|nr:hypothetical protein [Nevskiaceae bacterium]
MTSTYLTTDALAERIHYDPRTIRNQLKDSVLIEGVHYFRPFGGRKILYIWEVIERDMRGTPADVGRAVEDGVDESGIGPLEAAKESTVVQITAPRRPDKTGITKRGHRPVLVIPMANGGICNG